MSDRAKGIDMLLFLGYIVAAVGGIWLAVIAFKESIWWGLGSLFVPFVGLIYAITRWEKTKVPFLISIGGIVLLIIGIFTTANSLQP